MHALKPVPATLAENPPHLGGLTRDVQALQLRAVPALLAAQRMKHAAGGRPSDPRYVMPVRVVK